MTLPMNFLNICSLIHKGKTSKLSEPHICATQNLGFSSDSDTTLLDAPWVSHGTSLGPSFIICKNENHYTTYLLRMLGKEQPMEVLESNL